MPKSKPESKVAIESNPQSKSPGSKEIPAPKVKPKDSQPDQKSTNSSANWLVRHKVLLIVLGIILLVLSVLAVPLLITYQKALLIQAKAQASQTHVTGVLDSFKNQNLPAVKAELDALKSDLSETKAIYDTLSFWKYSPFKNHYHDGELVFASASLGIEAGEILISAIEPYIDILGLSGSEPATASSGTAEDRITTIIETIPLILPKLDEIEAKVAAIDANIDQIDPQRYPFKIKDTDVSQLITKAKTTLHQVDQSLVDYRPVIEQLPKVAGGESPQTYLVLFQNDGELRPTGGFITAYSQMKIDQGKIVPERSDDIYELDLKFRSRIEAPDPILEYLDNVYYWNLRDMNLSPDFKVSMDTFSSHYTQIPGEPDEIDGIIAVDTQVLVHLIEVLGPVDVPGYGIFTAQNEPRCNCPQVVYALENMITRPTPYHRSDRKSVLGPLLSAVLRKAYDAPSEQNAPLFQAINKDVTEKHILFYFTDEFTQKAAETINVAGRIKPFDADYLHINDANLGGAKSNMFTTQEVSHDVTIEGDHLKNKVTVAYKNPQKSDNCNLEAGLLCLNGVLRDWVRFYVPKGSQLINSTGFEDGTVKTSDDLDKTVFEGFFKLTPESQAKISVEYSVPYDPGSEYKLLIQKQPGTKEPEYHVTVNDLRQDFNLVTDKEITIDVDYE